MQTQVLKQESPEWMNTIGTRSDQASKQTEKTTQTESQRDSGVVSEQAVLRTEAVELPSVQLSLSAQWRDSQSVGEYSPAELDFLSRLKARDQEVKTHEAAHLARAGAFATSGASYTYQEGPNGQQYAIGGEVSIDVSPVANDPEATINKADTLVAAALSPSSPSPQDFKVADQARQMRIQAVRELAIQEAQDQQADRQQSADTDAEQLQQTQAISLEMKKAEYWKAEDNKLESEQQRIKEEQKQAEKDKQTAEMESQTNVNAQDESGKKTDEVSKQMTERLASLNELFARYDEARKTYQAIIDFFSNQYERSKQKDTSTTRIELFA